MFMSGEITCLILKFGVGKPYMCHVQCTRDTTCSKKAQKMQTSRFFIHRLIIDFSISDLKLTNLVWYASVSG